MCSVHGCNFNQLYQQENFKKTKYKEKSERDLRFKIEMKEEQEKFEKKNTRKKV